MLALLLLLGQDVEALVERLRTEAFAERDAAERAIVERGTSALPELRKHEEDPDPEVRIRVRRAVAEIGRRDRIRILQSAPPRLTLRLEQAPLSEALRKAFEPFGVKAAVWPREMEGRKVSLDLREATLWRALDAFCAAAGVHLDGEYTMPDLGWRFAEGAAPRPPRSADVGEGRLLADTEDVGGRCCLSLKGWLPAGSLPARVRLEDVDVRGDRGRAAGFDTSETGATAWRRAAGPTAFEIRWTAPWSELEGLQSLELSGTLLLAYPGDLERLEVPIAGFRGPKELQLAGVTLVLKSLSPEGHEIADIRWPEGTPERVFREWYEDERGRLFEEGFLYTVGGRIGSRGGKDFNGRSAVQPAKLVIARLIETDPPLRLPFTIRDVPLRRR